MRSSLVSGTLGLGGSGSGSGSGAEGGSWGWRWLDVVVLLWVDLPEETVVLSDAALLVNDTFLVAPVYERGELFNAFVRVHLPAAVVLCFEPD